MKWENEIVQGDALELLRELPDGCVDVVLTDPPYYKVVPEAWDRQWADVWVFYAWCEAVGRELSRVLKPNGSLFWFCNEKMAAYAQVGLDKVFALVNCLVWNKGGGMGLKGWRELRGFAACTERVLFYEQRSTAGAPAGGLEAIHSREDCFTGLRAYMRGELAAWMAAEGIETRAAAMARLREHLGHSAAGHYFGRSQWALPNAENYARLQALGYWKRPYDGLRAEYEGLRAEYEGLLRVWNAAPLGDVLHCAAVAGELHPTQKPEGILVQLLEQCTRPGMLVLDPFAGSGSTAAAAWKLGLRYVCFERDGEYAARAQERMNGLKKQILLPFGADKQEQIELL